MLFRYAFRNAMLPATTMAGLTYAYLIGAAVVVETVFSWGGLGQYAVQAITNSDYAAVSGTVLATTIYALLIYLILDFLYVAIDPRIRY
jgi:peptide/nickel transport system permease protein